jgi:hypothetical protein
MSDEKNDKPEIVKVNTPAGLSTETLLKMLVDAQTQAAEANQQLAEALLESRKPYVDPAVLEQKRLAMEQRQKDVALELRKRVMTKAQCPHLRTNSDGSFGDKLNIKWMEHSNGIIKGVCGTCFSEFDTRNPKDLDFLRKDGKAFKNMGHARGV